ncbi:dihydropteroate synthase [Salipiger aestuarii]|uniref:Dihydropteroate synthase n=1 Tax=Salipiger aestuarii TaxID=568098 RepID=A0A327Y5W9_9RHOB|nr:dihydropteroate synthase [Salipiger aestuarii]EIE52044.1 dihydropteroate synthase [Citreicella sp. 357]KAA8608107.1 dihydropteroate synthase [Salipiger aestuarii]KAA8611359.1 dihydropteroate synthase [Salipiger aestuarii]KAB2542071.1 dihydropteroate synthase [Salipiger aestuarii]RAK16490.1 dihydropteroate synthase [Salipiger aestuarii]
MQDYFRPLVRSDRPRPDNALPLAGSPRWFTHVARHRRDGSVTRLPASDLPDDVATRLSAPRGTLMGLPMDRPQIMGILNVTPDSFSDGGRDRTAPEAARRGRTLVTEGADLLDIGGESTRPGASTVPVGEEIGRTEPVIRALAGLPISIDTRKLAVARAAMRAGASMVNDVSGLTFDPALADYCVDNALPVCIMHAQGDPQTMQDAPHYDDVLLDVYDFLAGQADRLVAAGLARDKIVIDPGIGFGKTTQHNLALLRGLSLLHGIGCPILLGVSRKGFIGRIGKAPDPAARAPGSIAAALTGVTQGVQILRVHDVAQTRQALALWQAVENGDSHDS